MAVVFPWLPIGTNIHGCESGRLLKEGGVYQVLAARSNEQTLLLLRHDALQDSIISTLTLPTVAYGDSRFHVGLFPTDQTPIRVSEVAARSDFQSAGQLLDLAKGLHELGARMPEALWAEALYLPGQGTCIGVSRGTEDRHLLAVRLLTGGVSDKRLSASQIRQYNPWVTASDVVDFFETMGVAPEPAQLSSQKEAVEFCLPGRPELELFFREYIIDFFVRRPEYEAMGIRAPNGVLLYGPPGSGKTHAVRKLAKHLGWPMFEIGMGTIGSPYIHQTSVTLKRVFDDAAAKPPSLILMDEVDAVVGQRSLGDEHKAEEVAEMLKLLENAGARGVLVIATTNRIEAIDPAMLRKGRFDHKIEVGNPNHEEIRSALEALLAARPTAPGIDLDTAAVQLDGRPMSDVAWVVDDAARLAVKSGKPAVDNECLVGAVSRLTEA